jgi:tetratricopeptide (TPR) repeat protein
VNDKVIVETLTLLTIIGVSGGFGGMVNALQKTHSLSTENEYERKYILPCPLNPSRPKKLGFFGDMIVGSAAGISIFIGFEGILGLDITVAQGQAIDFVRLIALGVVSGYMGTSILDSLALGFSRHLLKKRHEYDQEVNKLNELEKQFVLSRQVARLVWVGDAFLRWKNYDEALDLYERALTLEPNNVHTLIHKSFVLTDMAEDEAKNTQERTVLYASAIKDMETVINIIPENIKNSLDRYNKGRGYYNLACYKTQYYLLKDK